jgi:single-stranded DNA-binding protein
MPRTASSIKQFFGRAPVSLGLNMTVAVLITGALFRKPESKTSQSGKTYVKATIKTQSAADNSACDFWNVLCFSETGSAELMRLDDTDRVSVQGTLKLELYQGKISRTVFADQVLALRAPKRERNKPSSDREATAPYAPAGSRPAFSDDIPFAPEVR